MGMGGAIVIGCHGDEDDFCPIPALFIQLDGLGAGAGRGQVGSDRKHP